MTTTCLDCERLQDDERPSCAECGGVCLRDQRWQRSSGPSASTPLVRTRIPWLRGTWLKFEGAHPSGSFKDRVMGTLVEEAVDQGAGGAVVASSGNAAVAASSHAARHGLPLLVVVPSTAPQPIIRMVARRGAGLIEAGEGPAAAHHVAKIVAARLGLPNLTSTFAATGCEWACRGIGHEIAEQLDQPANITTVAASVSVGPVLMGAARGLCEKAGVEARMVAGQAAGCAPIARAFTTRADQVEPWTGEVVTGATSIADRLSGYAREATSFLAAVRASGGSVAAADDDELAEIREELGRYDGLDVELSSCAALAALRSDGSAGQSAVAVLTGAGLRETLAAPAPPTPEQDEVLNTFLERVTGGETTAKEVAGWMTESG